MLTALNQLRLIERPCGCGAAALDSRGNVRSVKSCPACLNNCLDFIRQTCYDANDIGGVGRERQLDLFEVNLSGEAPLLAFPEEED